VELLGGPLAGVATTDPTVVGNGLCFLLVDPQAFCPTDRFKSLVGAAVAYIKSSRPADDAGEVLVPGEIEFRTLRRRLREGIPVDDPTWEAIHQYARKLQVELEPLLTG
jgi:uncharacterized oxidoreductase